MPTYPNANTIQSFISNLQQIIKTQEISPNTPIYFFINNNYYYQDNKDFTLKEADPEIVDNSTCLVFNFYKNNFDIFAFNEEYDVYPLD